MLEGPTRLALVGAIMGGTASLVAAAKNRTEVEAVITLSAPRPIEGLTAGPEVMRARGRRQALHGRRRGPTSAAASASTLYEESLQPKKLEILTTSDHGTDLLTREPGRARPDLIQTWLGQYLPVSEPAAQG